MEKRVIVLMGPAGAGKSSVASYIKEKWQVPQVITHTTRAKRQGEEDGRDYYFESDQSFAQNHYLESVHYGGHQYGSSMEGLERAFEKKALVSIVLDTKGASTYRKILGDEAWLWYITTSDPAKLKKRLVARGDSKEAIEKRLTSAEFQRDLALPADLEGVATVIKNDDWTETKARIDDLVAGALKS
ncbi:guanylate kinase [Fructobacillus parabroussonetiae]|uniref:Guanylate kinase n=1 Tax=Fructobacillus parabroussonetiae TaxID=2713174 RepID=A0ABS5QZF3_9LACO|nr:guanylate kinase [Fructobacillus parabroussonetiae]MBS9337287.1 guanylate kinase [Fructobacillus parabroussonetiae]